MAKKQETFSYDADADVASVELARWDIVYAKQMGNVIVHFSKENIPVYLEFIDASKFFDRIHGMVKGVQAQPAAQPA